jgi:hypothetical protein
MANTYTQSYFHLIFAVKNREALIKKEWRNELEMYITGIIRNQQIHHKKKTFREEYLEMLRKNEIQFSDEYLFDFFDDLMVDL